MNDYNKFNGNVQTFSDDDCDLIPVPSSPIVPISKKSFSNPTLTFDNATDESNLNEKDIIAPDTLFSPKDKVSNRTWENKLPIGRDFGIVTARKHENFGCVVQLNYEKIINSEDVITGAVLSDFDRCVYDAVVTLFVAGNMTFTTNDIWRIVAHNRHTRLTPSERDKIIKSMFHISRFWMTIVTDDSEKYSTWFALNSNRPFNSERKLYKKLLSTYTGRLLDFCVIGNITFDVSYELDGQKVTDKESFAQIWKILNTPILYKYAKDKAQISSVPLYLLDTSKQPDKLNALKRGSHNDELAHFLSREIDTMKKTAKRKQSYSHIILLERIYKIDGIDDIQQNDNNIWKKKKRTCDKLNKLLCRFKENGVIKNHTLHKKTIGKSLTFYSVEIFI